MNPPPCPAHTARPAPAPAREGAGGGRSPAGGSDGDGPAGRGLRGRKKKKRATGRKGAAQECKCTHAVAIVLDSAGRLMKVLTGGGGGGEEGPMEISSGIKTERRGLLFVLTHT